MNASKICGIYEIKNKINDKRYIGQSTNIENRFIRHKSKLKNNKHINLPLQNAYNNGDRFDYNILLTCERNNLSFCEKWCISALDTTNPNKGYNISPGGESTNFGKKFSEEHNRKISEAISGEKHWNYGKHRSEETKRKISESHRGEKSSWYGKHHTKESIRKISESKVGKKNPPTSKHYTEEYKMKMSKLQMGKCNSFYGKKHTEETKKKMSMSQKGHKRSIETINKYKNSCLLRKIIKQQNNVKEIL